MTSTVSSVFSTNTPSNTYTIHDEVNLGDILSTFSSKNALIPTSALNSCYQKALSLLRDCTKEAASQLDALSKPTSLSYNVTEDDFDTTVFPDRLLTPSSVTICQWRHEQFLNDKFLRLLLPLVAESMHAIVLNWFEVELHNEEERQRKNDLKKNELQEQVFELKSMAKSIDIDRLYELSGSSKDVLIDQVDWKLIATKMRSKGGFKYFDEYSLRRIWLYRCQYGVNTSWSDEEDDLLNQLVQQYGIGKWMEIAQHELFQVNLFK